MKRGLLLLGAVSCALLVLTGPAISAGRWVPVPVDFELAPRGTDAARTSGGPLVSAELRAPKRFNLVGLRWRGGEAEIAVRTRKDGEDWTAWTDLPAHAEHAPEAGVEGRSDEISSEPLWAGEADWVQYRSSRRLPGLRLHFVNTTGTATAADRVRTSLRRAVNGAAIAVAGLTSARAAESRPAIRSRDAWGARYCPPRRRPDRGVVKAALIHHTVTPNGYSRSAVPSMILGICRYHRNSRGWDDIGYNFLVDRFGRAWEGRAGGVGEAIVGAQAQGFNTQTTGIANLGTHSKVRQSGAAIAAIARLIRWKLPHHGQPTFGRATVTSTGGPASRYRAGQRVAIHRVSGHRDTGRTECPGGALYGQLASLRRRVERRSPASSSRPAVSASLRAAVVDYGARATVLGSARDPSGGGLPEAPLKLQRLSGDTWRTLAGGTSDRGGAFSFDLRAVERSALRVRYPGGPGLDAATSPRLLLQVRAVLTARVSAPAPGGEVAIAGRIVPSKSAVRVLVERRSRGRFRRFASMSASTRRGRYRVNYRFTRTGSYRVLARFAGDRRHMASDSPPVEVRVTGDEYRPSRAG